jgi:preprotein translocase subunit SecG
VEKVVIVVVVVVIVVVVVAAKRSWSADNSVAISTGARG